MSTNYNTLIERIEDLEYRYYKSGEYYRLINRLFTIPSIFLTSLSSVFSFLSSSNDTEARIKQYFLLAVTISTATSTLLQTVNSSCRFSLKKDKFMTAANEFDSLADSIIFETLFNNDDDFHQKLELDIRKIKEKCGFLPVY